LHDTVYRFPHDTPRGLDRLLARLTPLLSIR
jgi:hypothetical protein